MTGPALEERVEADVALKEGEVSCGRLAGEPSLEYQAYVPRSRARRILVSVHGISENPVSHARLFAPLAEQQQVLVIAPHFRRPTWRDYQRLGREGMGPRADRALDRLVAAVGRRSGANTGRFFLFGYSGGGQFVHRFLMAHPRRVAAAAVASAGWYTFPTRRRRYPHGIGETQELPDLTFDADAFLRVPLLVTVGEEDVRREVSLRQSARIDRQQGATRRERAQRFVAAMESAATRRRIPSPVALRLLLGQGHSFEENVAGSGLAEMVFEYFFAGGTSEPRRP